MKNALIRALRTYLHSAIGLLLAAPMLHLDVAAWKVIAVSAAPAALSVIQNWLEESGVGLGPRG